MQTDSNYGTYNDYVNEEWKMFEADGTRRTAFLRATAGVAVRRVLDIGCGAGQEMLPFVENGACGFGLDVTPDVGQVGRRLYATKNLENKINFLRASGNELPFASESFDVLICRGALMFMRNSHALAEMARVLNQNGVFFLMFQAPPYYWDKIGRGLRSGNFKSSIHAARVLLNGNRYLLTGKQSFGKLSAGGEIFQTKKSVAREIERFGLKIIDEMPDTNPQTPFLIVKKA